MKTVIAPLCSKLFLFFLVIITTVFTSCKKESESEQAMTSEEAAEVMSQSVTDENNGAITSLENETSGTYNGSDSAEITIRDSVFIHTGSVVSKLRRKLKFTREARFRDIRIVINRAHRMIVSGAIEITIKGTNSQGGTFYYTGILTFHGNGNGTLVLQNGQTFHLHW